MFNKHKSMPSKASGVSSTIVGVLTEQDAEALRKWSDIEAEPSVYIRRDLGEAALGVGTYGIVVSPDGLPTNFIAMGDDTGTVIGDNPDVYAQKGLPIDGPVAAFERLTDSERHGGMIRAYNPYYGKKVSVDTPEGLEYDWDVEAVGKDGTVYLARGDEMRQVASDRVDPLYSHLELPSAHDRERLDKLRQQEREQHRQKRLHALFDLPSEEQMRQDPNIRKRFAVTAESVGDAVFAYRYIDDELQQIIREYKTEELWREDDMPMLIRTNNELRVRLGAMLLDEIDENGYRYSERIANDSEKTINSWGYRAVGTTSREVTAMIALAMLDGTYKKPKSDPIIVNGTRDFRGQHRYVAYKILNTPARAWEDIVQQV